MSILLKRYMIWKQFCRNFTYTKHTTVLGIETSCDDTGCAVIDGTGKILGEALNSQGKTHLRYGGVNPLVARDLHRENIDKVAKEALERASINIKDIGAIAVTVKPGLLISLEIGVKYARYLAKTYNKPLIPIHHMEAHALVARMYHSISLPFLALLISGGHCLLTFVKDIDDFLLLGESIDIAPGEALDKAARRMKLRNLKVYSECPGGRAIEMASRNSTDPFYFKFPLPLTKNRDCNFSFSGLQDALLRHLIEKEQEHNTVGDRIIPEVDNLSAAFQLAIAEHIAHRTERAIVFCENQILFEKSDNRNLVVSGGVACNDFIFKSIEAIGKKSGYKVFRPPPKYCTDNGVMIAWNGIERIRKNCEPIPLNIDPSATLGRNFIHKLRAADLQVRVTRLKSLNVI